MFFTVVWKPSIQKKNVVVNYAPGNRVISVVLINAFSRSYFVFKFLSKTMFLSSCNFRSVFLNGSDFTVSVVRSVHHSGFEKIVLLYKIPVW
jgi:hypothetical protein